MCAYWAGYLARGVAIDAMGLAKAAKLSKWPDWFDDSLGHPLEQLHKGLVNSIAYILRSLFDLRRVQVNLVLSKILACQYLLRSSCAYGPSF